MHPLTHDEFTLPDLRFVPVEALVPHEQHDAQRLQPILERIREQAVLKNPPIVSPLPASDEGDERFVVLDGANRTSAVREAGLPHVVVQVVPYERPAVTLSTWFHALGEFPHHALEAECACIPGLTCRATTLLAARALLARREAIAYLACDDGMVTTLHGGKTLKERNAQLNAIVDTYRGRRRFYRVTTDTIETVRESHPDVTSLVVFPHFEPAEVLELATSGERLPAGITRHLIHWRALRVNVPLDRLADRTQTVAEKNQWLDAWLLDKTAKRQVRFYEESTVLFDE